MTYLDDIPTRSFSHSIRYVTQMVALKTTFSSLGFSKEEAAFLRQPMIPDGTQENDGLDKLATHCGKDEASSPRLLEHVQTCQRGLGHRLSKPHQSTSGELRTRVGCASEGHRPVDEQCAGAQVQEPTGACARPVQETQIKKARTDSGAETHHAVARKGRPSAHGQPSEGLLLRDAGEEATSREGEHWSSALSRGHRPRVVSSDGKADEFVFFVACRDIEAGAELTFDYNRGIAREGSPGASDAVMKQHRACMCGSEKCRRVC
jgi:hypothetical protein